VGYFSKTWVLGWATLGLATFSQAPEFSQQYKQRLGGAINELATVVRQFDEDATSQGLTRQEALDTLQTSQEEFPRKAGYINSQSDQSFRKPAFPAPNHGSCRPLHAAGSSFALPRC